MSGEDPLGVSKKKDGPSTTESYEDISAKDVNELRVIVGDLRAKLQTREGQLKETKIKVMSYMSKNKQTQTEHEQKCATLETRVQEVTRQLESKVMQYNTDMLALTQNLTQLQNIKLETDNSLAAMRKKLELDTTTHDNDVKSLSEQLQAARTDSYAASEKLAKLMEVDRKMNDEIKSLKQENATLKSTGTPMTSTEGEIDPLQAERTKLIQEQQKIEEQRQTMVKKMRAMQAELKKVTAEKVALEQAQPSQATIHVQDASFRQGLAPEPEQGTSELDTLKILLKESQSMVEAEKLKAQKAEAAASEERASVRATYQTEKAKLEEQVLATQTERARVKEIWEVEKRKLAEDKRSVEQLKQRLLANSTSEEKPVTNSGEPSTTDANKEQSTDKLSQELALSRSKYSELEQQLDESKQLVDRLQQELEASRSEQELREQRSELQQRATSELQIAQEELSSQAIATSRLETRIQTLEQALSEVSGALANEKSLREILQAQAEISNAKPQVRDEEEVRAEIELRQQLKQAEEKVSDFQEKSSKLVSLQDDLALAESKIQELQVHCQVLEAEQQELEAIKTQLRVANEQLLLAQTEMATVQGLFDEYKSESEKQTQGVREELQTQFTQQIKQQTEKLERELEAEREESSAKLAASERDLEKSGENLKEMQKMLAQEQLLATKQSSEQVQELMQRLQATLEETAQAQSQKTDLERLLSDSRKESDSIKTQLEAVRAELSQQEEQTQHSLEQLRTNCAQLNTQVQENFESFAKERTVFQERLQATQAELDNLTVSIAKEKEISASALQALAEMRQQQEHADGILQSNVQNLESQIGKLQEDLNQAKDTDVQIRADLELKTSELQRAQQLIGEFEQISANSDSLHVEAARKVLELESRVEQEQSAAMSLKSSSLQREAESEARLQSTHEELKQAQQQKTEVERQLEQSKQSNEDLQLQLEAVTNKSKEFQVNVLELQDRLSENHSQVDARVQEKDAELQELILKLTGVEQAKKDIESEAASLRIEYVQAQAGWESQLQIAKVALESKRQELQESVEQASTIQTLREALDTEVQNLQASNTLAQQTIKDHESELARLREKQSTEEAGLESLRIQVEEKAKQLERSDELVQELQSKFAEAENFQQQHGQLQALLEQEQRLRVSTNNQLQTTNEELEQLTTQSKEMQVSFKQTNDSLRAELEIAESDVRRHVALGQESELLITQLKKTLETKDSEKEELKQSLESKQTECQRLQERLDETRGSIASQMESLQTEIDQLQNQLKESQLFGETKEATFAKEREDLVSKLGRAEEASTDARGQITALESTQVASSVQLQEISSKLEHEAKERKDAQSQIEAVRAELAASVALGVEQQNQVAAAELALVDLREKVESLQHLSTRLESTQTELQEKQRCFAELQEQSNSLKELLEAEKGHHTTAKLEVEGLNQALENTRNEQSTTEARVILLEQELKMLQDAKVDMEQANKGLKSQVLAMDELLEENRRLHTVVAEVENLEAKYGESKEQNGQEALATALKEKQQLAASLAGLQAEIRVLKLENADLKDSKEQERKLSEIQIKLLVDHCDKRKRK